MNTHKMTQGFGVYIGIYIKYLALCAMAIFVHSCSEPISFNTTQTVLDVFESVGIDKKLLTTLLRWLGLLFGLVVFYVSKKVIVYLIQRFVRITKVTFTDIHLRIISLIQPHISAVGAWVVLYMYVSYLGFSTEGMIYVSTAVKICISLSIFKALYKLTDLIPDAFEFFAKNSHFKLEKPLVTIVVKAVKVFVVLVVPLVILQNLGVNVASILAGLGLGGLAFALAAKDTLANLFGSLMILLDKPFSVGDWVIMGGKEGTVEEIGLRSTRLRTFYDSVLSIPNSEVINGNIDNMGKRHYRRIKTTLGLTYDSPPQQIRQFLQSLRTYLTDHPHTRSGAEHHVVVSHFNESSVDVLLYFFLDVKDWTQELHVREEIMLHILDLAQDVGISFAFPTRSIHMLTDEPADKDKKSTPSQKAAASRDQKS
ncbi:MAG: mechanosensitive ion channel family protein [Proteobacteria bacterium]|nr:mechanosensitive ion channel family protein [Pseudomonadota bacterium]